MLIQQVLQVKAIPGVITLPPSAAMSEVIEVLSKKRIGGIVIASDKKFCEGIISERDIVKILSRNGAVALAHTCLLYTSPSPRDPKTSRMPSSA